MTGKVANGTFQVDAPKSRHIYSYQLLCRHRNSAKIYDFWSHNLQLKTDKGGEVFSVLNGKNDLDKLPSGPEPMLIRRDRHVPLYNLLCDLDKEVKAHTALQKDQRVLE